MMPCRIAAMRPAERPRARPSPPGFPAWISPGVFAILTIATACGGVIFNATTISMPKVFDERLSALTNSTFGIGALVCGER
jgi:hypothetical protein